MMTYEDAERILCNQCIHHVYCMIHDEECEPMKSLKQPQWIPVSERLPEERGNYLATIKVEAGTFVIYVWFGEEGWIDGYSEPINVIAWMPLPPAFVEGDKE